MSEELELFDVIKDNVCWEGHNNLASVDVNKLRDAILAAGYTKQPAKELELVLCDDCSKDIRDGDVIVDGCVRCYAMKAKQKPAEKLVPTNMSVPKFIGKRDREIVVEKLRNLQAKPNYDNGDIDELIFFCAKFGTPPPTELVEVLITTIKEMMNHDDPRVIEDIGKQALANVKGEQP